MRPAFLVPPLFAAALAAPAALAADPRVVQCEITTGGARIDGPCTFTPRRGGSFEIAMTGGRMMGDAARLALDVTRPGEGEVRAVSAAGVRAPWGPVRREAADGACWRGDAFTVCVRAPVATAAAAGGTVFAGRCHMDACWWVDQSPAHEIGPGSAAIPGRRVEVTQRIAETEHPGAAYPDAPPPGTPWSDPAPAQFFCSTVRPAFRETEGGAWTLLPLPQVFGATEGVSRMYLRACHPGAPDDPYSAPEEQGYAARPGETGTRYDDFDALVAR